MPLPAITVAQMAQELGVCGAWGDPVPSEHPWLLREKLVTWERGLGNKPEASGPTLAFHTDPSFPHPRVLKTAWTGVAVGLEG